MLQPLGKVTDTMSTMTTTMTKIEFKIRETADTLLTRFRIEELETYKGEMDDIIMQLEWRLNEQGNFGQHD